MPFDLIIVGSGAAGLAAGLYAGRYRMKVLLISGEFGGETAKAGVIYNYPGNREVDGYELMKIMRSQTEDVGVKTINGWATSIKNEDGCFSVLVDDGAMEYKSSSVILSVGTKRRRLGLAREDEFTGRGVHYCVTCDGPLYGNKTVAMVGGGDASVKGVIDIADHATKVYFIVRGSELKAEPVNVDEMKKLGDKVEVLFQTEVVSLHGDKFLDKIVLSKEFKGSKELKIDGLFVEIGADPNNQLAVGVGAMLDQYGYVVADNMMRTNTPGFFVAGDATNFFGRFKQDITAAATGSVAATSAYNYVKEHGGLCLTNNL